MTILQLYILLSIVIAFAAMMVEYSNNAAETDQGVVVLNVGLEGVLYLLAWPLLASRPLIVFVYIFLKRGLTLLTQRSESRG